MTSEEKLDAMMVMLNEILDRLPPAVATVFQIRGKYGTPKINFDPKSWSGRSYKGCQASDCPSDFLEAYAEALEYMVKNPKPDADPKYVVYNRRDAALCRRWAIERSSRTGAESVAPSNAADVIPF
jgi:hypothetical protein